MKNLSSLYIVAKLNVVLVCALSGQNTNFDFGTGAGKVTFENAGFTAVSDGTAVIENTESGVNMGLLDTTRANFGIFQTFAGLGSALRNDFSITTTLELTAVRESSSSDRFGIHLFADLADIRNTGIHLRLETQTSRAYAVEIEDGLDDSGIAAEEWTGSSPFAVSSALTLTVVGTFLNEGSELNLDFTVDDGTTTQSLAATITDVALLSGDAFGLSGRSAGPMTAVFKTLSVSVATGAAMWQGFGVVDGWADTGVGNLGWLYVQNDPWIYSNSLQGWFYVPAEFSLTSGSGNWLYITK